MKLKTLSGRLLPKDSYIRETFFDRSDPLSKGRRCILGSSFTDGIITSLTSGVYFTGLLLAMGASETYIGYTSAAISFSGIFQLLSPLLLEKLPRRKGFLIGAKLIYHLLNIVGIGLLPFLPIAAELKLVLFMLALIVMYACNYIAAPGISAWQMQSLPTDKRVHYYSVSHLGIAVLTKISAFLAGLLLDRFEADSISLFGASPTITAILLLRCGALILMLIELGCFIGIREFPYQTDAGQPGLKLLLQPLKNSLFMRTIFLPVAWYFIVAIVGQYFSIYLLEDVKLSYSLISLGGFFSMPAAILAAPLWHRAIGKVSWPKLLAVGLLGNALAYSLNPFITVRTLPIYFFCILCGTFFDVCLSNVTSNLIYLHMPQENRTAYFSLYSILVLVSKFLGSNTGILFIRLTGDLHFRLLGFSIGNKQAISFLSAALFILLALFALRCSRDQKLNVRF